MLPAYWKIHTKLQMPRFYHNGEYDLVLKHFFCQGYIMLPCLYQQHNWRQTRYSHGRLLTLGHTVLLRDTVIDLAFYVQTIKRVALKTQTLQMILTTVMAIYLALDFNEERYHSQYSIVIPFQ